MRLEELNLYDIGNTIQIAGAIYTGNGKTFLVYLPGEKTDLPKTELQMDRVGWEKFLRQTDILEVEVWASTWPTCGGTPTNCGTLRAIFRS